MHSQGCTPSSVGPISSKQTLQVPVVAFEEEEQPASLAIQRRFVRQEPQQQAARELDAHRQRSTYTSRGHASDGPDTPGPHSPLECRDAQIIGGRRKISAAARLGERAWGGAGKAGGVAGWGWGGRGVWHARRERGGMPQDHTGNYWKSAVSTVLELIWAHFRIIMTTRVPKTRFRVILSFQKSLERDPRTAVTTGRLSEEFPTQISRKPADCRVGRVIGEGMWGRGSRSPRRQ